MTQIPFHSYEEFAEAWKRRKLPEPMPLENLNLVPAGRDCRKVNFRTSASCHASPRLKRLATVPLLTLCLLLAAGTTLSARLWDTFTLRNNKGEVTLSYTLNSPEEIKKEALRRHLNLKYRDIIDKRWQIVYPGQLSFLVIPELYGLTGVYNQYQEEKSFATPEALQNGTTTPFKLPAYLPEKLSFLEGSILYKGEEVDPQALYIEAQAADMEYIVQSVPLNSEATRLSVEYGTPAGPDRAIVPKLRITINRIAGSSMTAMHDGYADKVHYEVISIHGNEALYMEAEQTLHVFLKTADGGLLYNIKVLNHNTSVNAELGEEQVQPTPKEELIKIAESLLAE